MTETSTQQRPSVLGYLVVRPSMTGKAFVDDWSAEVYPTREEAEREAQRARQSVHVHDWRAVAVLEPAELDRLLTAVGINPDEIAPTS